MGESCVVLYKIAEIGKFKHNESFNVFMLFNKQVVLVILIEPTNVSFLV
jgi:hypothetical protein